MDYVNLYCVLNYYQAEYYSVRISTLVDLEPLFALSSIVLPSDARG